MTQKYRLHSGGRIRRDVPLEFVFNGERMQGYEGDTIASALLANGARTVARSFKYRRPRGIFAAGVEEPCAIVQTGKGAQRTPNVRATLAELQDGMIVQTQSGWPSADHDFGAIVSAAGRMLPAGFYYKTFMWPPKLWMWYEKVIRRAASSARVPEQTDPDTYLHRHAHCDVLIAGGGPAGLAAGLAAGLSGARVIIADLNPEFGGDLLNDGGESQIDGKRSDEWLAATIKQLSEMDNVQLLSRTTVQGYHDYNYLTAEERIAGDGQLRRRLWKIRAAQVVVAAGAIERPPVFADNDRPGIMLASAVRSCIHRYGVLPGHNFLFFVNNDSAYQSALAAQAAGARRVEIADLRANADGYWQERARDAGIPIHLGFGVVGVLSTGGALNVQIAKLSPGGDFIAGAGGGLSSLYDVLAVSGGWTPTAHLFSQARGQLSWNSSCGAFAPDEAHLINACRACGSAAATFALSECLRGGTEAGVAAAKDAGFTSDSVITAPSALPPPVECAPLFSPFVPTRHEPGQGPAKHFVDFANDVTAADIFLAAQEGYESVEHMKRYTAAGFGTEQGKTGNINALNLLAHARGMSPAETGHTTFRPQYTPMAFGSVAGAELNDLFAPLRTTPMHEWHEQHDAVYEDVGEWKRPCYFPRDKEGMAAAVARECRAARNGVGLMDATTLGKIDIQGPDAEEFLDRIYSNNIASLKPGRCRYSLMLREDGMVYDDGVAMRLGDNHFHITTSTGHAAGVMNWLEEWLQTEWPQLRVFCTSVTEQWAVAALVGPKSREVLSKICSASLSAEKFPFMSLQECEVAGVPARVCRVSFSGELAFEINVPARAGLQVWKEIVRAGEEFDITPYGTETMRVLRAEKGYIIAGQDSDGATSPIDMGLSWMLSKKKKDYIGRRSLSRAAMTAPGRFQFVGLLPEDSQTVIPEGAAIAPSATARAPFVSEGYVTSSYMSATLERSIALAMIKDGVSRYDQIVHAALMDGRLIPAKVVKPVFWDPEESRRDG